MHPILTSRTRIALYLAAWIPIAIVLSAILARDAGFRLSEAAIVVFPMCVVYAFVCLASWYLCRTIPLRESAVLGIVATHGAAAVVSSGVWLLAGQLWVAVLSTSPYFQGLSQRYSQQLPILFLSGILLFLLAVTSHYLLVTFEASRHAETRALESQVLAREAELKALRAQIDPHFLFNSLNSISALTTADPVAARKMCLLLADFLRGCLKLGSAERISLAEEMRLAENYLDIERVRLGSRLMVERNIDPACERCLVPPLIIQPLVENAVTHGIAPMLEGGTVRIAARHAGGVLKIVLENPFEPETTARNGAGLGIENVKMRLMNLFANAARLDVQKSEQWFRVELQLPCES